MAASRIVLTTVNPLLAHNPETAIAVAGGLVAVGAGLTLRHALHQLGIRDANMTRSENLEVDLLDEEAPDGFWHEAVSGIHGGLVSAKMTAGTVTPRLRWLPSRLFKIDHQVNPATDGFAEPARMVDLTTVNTRTLDEVSGKLV